jgi:hypothetical protein
LSEDVGYQIGGASRLSMNILTSIDLNQVCSSHPYKGDVSNITSPSHVFLSKPTAWQGPQMFHNMLAVSHKMDEREYRRILASSSA